MTDEDHARAILVTFVFCVLDFLFVILAVATLSKVLTRAQFHEARVVVATIGWLLVPTVVSRFRAMVGP